MDTRRRPCKTTCRQGLLWLYIFIYIYIIKWTVFVNVTTKSAQHAHARMITIIVEKVQVYINVENLVNIIDGLLWLCINFC